MNLTSVVSALLILSSIGTASVAVADRAAGAGQQQPFLILDRPGGASSSGADVSLASSPASEIAAGLRIDPHIEHLTSKRGGLIATLPMAVLLSDDDNETALGNLELGGFALFPTGPGASLVLRGSLALPTASDDLGGLITNILAGNGRIGDLALAVPDALVVRGAGSYLYESDGLGLRGDVGIDLPFTDTANDSGFVRFSGGVALGAGATKFIGEVVNLLTLDSDIDTVVHQVSLGLASKTHQGTFKAALFGVSSGIPESDEDVVLGVSISHAWSY